MTLGITTNFSIIKLCSRITFTSADSSWCQEAAGGGGDSGRESTPPTSTPGSLQVLLRLQAVFVWLSPLREQAHFLDEKTASSVRTLDRVTFLFKNQEWNVHLRLQLHRQTSAPMATPRLDPTLWAHPSWTG